MYKFVNGIWDTTGKGKGKADYPPTEGRQDG